MNQTQTVHVHVGAKSGGRKRTAPTAKRTQTMNPMNQMLMMLGSLRNPPAPNDSLFQSTRLLNQMLEPMNRRLDVLLARPHPQPNITNIMPAQASVPAISERPQGYILDAPDDPLEKPPGALLPGGPQRLDDPHEDMDDIEDEFEDDIEEEQSSASASSSSSDPYEQYYNRRALSNLPIRSRNKSAVTIAKIASYLGVADRYTDVNSERKKFNKEQMIERILQKLDV